MMKKKIIKSKKIIKKIVVKKVNGPINKKMVIGDLAEKFPSAVEVMFKYGLHCIGCHVSPFETLEQGAMAHGLSAKQIDEMVSEINKVAGKGKKK